MRRKISNKKHIKELCIMYVSLINDNVEYYRIKIHQELIHRTRLPEKEINEVLHNLDKYIGLPVPVPFKPVTLLRPGEIKRYGEKLFSLLEEMMIDHVSKKLKNDGDTVEFFKTTGIEIEEWIDIWREKMEFDIYGNPVLHICKR